MAPRLNKRQQRELEELEALGKPAPATNDVDNDEGNAEEPVLTTTKPSGFAAVCFPVHRLRFAKYHSSLIQEMTPTRMKTSLLVARPRRFASSMNYRQMLTRRQSKKKKKAHPAEAASPPTPSTSTPKSNTPLPARNEKKAAKKAKAKARKAGNDELDEALAELSLKCVSHLSIYPSLTQLADTQRPQCSLRLPHSPSPKRSPPSCPYHYPI